MTSNLRITVLMSVYNSEEYYRDVIEIILNQAFKDCDFKKRTNFYRDLLKYQNDILRKIIKRTKSR